MPSALLAATAPAFSLPSIPDLMSFKTDGKTDLIFSVSALFLHIVYSFDDCCIVGHTSSSEVKSYYFYHTIIVANLQLFQRNKAKIAVSA